jgi:nucleotide-binding universal stress UspA family protein
MTKKLLCAVDGSDHATSAIKLAAEMAKAFGATLSLLVIDQVTFDGRGGGTSHKLGSEAVKKIHATSNAVAEAAGFKGARLDAVAGRDVARAILNFAEDNGIDHIVVGTGEKSAATRLVIGSVSHDLVVRAHCSVTVAR